MTPVVCLVTDRRQEAAGDVGALVERVTWAARAGVHLVHVRERDLEGSALTALVRQCVQAVRGTRTRVVVNDRLDVALAAGAHGVHLRADSVAAARVRAVAPRGFLVGRSLHSVAEALEAERRGGLDYVLFGSVFATGSKPGHVPEGIDGLNAVVGAVRLPVLAIGGMTPDKLPEVAATGAAGFAAISLFAVASEPMLRQAVSRAAMEWTKGRTR